MVVLVAGETMPMVKVLVAAVTPVEMVQ